MENEKNEGVGRINFRRFLTRRVIVGTMITIAVLWVVISVIGAFKKPKTEAHKEVVKSEESIPSHDPGTRDDSVHTPSPDQSTHQDSALPAPHPISPPAPEKSAPKANETSHTPIKRFPATGMAFVDSLIKPLEYEIKERFWGWRPNDLIRFTDNVNSFQLGVLEVTRRSAVILAERISRTGSTEAFDKNLENAMNWFMIKPTKYWFPSAESKYKMGLEEFRIYYTKLEKRQAAFYTRTDNLIPLLIAYEDLLGSCDENLVKQREKDGQPVSFFMADEYFFYAKGVASAMLTILEALQQDFDEIVESRKGMEVLHHAIESCRIATKISPWIVTNSDLSSIFANHRANMAAPISHARFYLGVLIKALST
ncbi:MAG: DUF2333 family protein [Thermodesulfobacteriota bacterium]